MNRYTLSDNRGIGARAFRFTLRLLAITAAFFAVQALSVPANAAVALSNGSLIYDSTTLLARFQFTLTSNTPGETISVLVFDADPGASWDDPNAAVVYASHPWTAIAVEPGEFFAGNLDTPVVFDGVSGINFDYIFQGTQNAVGNQWQISAGTPGQRINILDNVNLAIGVAGTVDSAVPEPSTGILLTAGLALAAMVRRRS